MIFQSNIESTSKEGNSWGIIATIGFHGLILAALLLIFIPEPESHPLDPVIMVNFGDPEMGGPSAEMAGGSGDESMAENAPSTPDEASAAEEVIDNPEAELAVKPAKSKVEPVKQNTPVTKPNPVVERKPEQGSTFIKRGPRKKGNGSGSSNGDGSSDGRGDGLIPGEGGDPNGVPDGSLDGDGYVKKQFRPKQIKKAEFNDDETDDPNPKRIYVIVTVSCSGIITKVKPDINHTTDTKNLKYISGKLKGEKFFDNRDNCKGPAAWPLEVIITPN
ncbi:MAG: hypothetical protein HYZ42_14150 [Bacteroidetes bacterium]|nr:hypothetical protein [Bacteroidota bacterium]